MSEMVSGWGQRATRPGARGPLFKVAVAALAALVVATLFVINLLHIPYYSLSPGPTAPVSQLITVPKARSHPVKGSILLVTVYQSALTPIQYWRAELDSQVQVLPAAAILGNTPASQLEQVDLEEMAASKQAAEVAALRRLGYPVTEHGTGALIGYVLRDTPAASALRAGQTITGLDGTAIRTASDLTAALAKDHPGQTIDLRVQNPKGSSASVRLTLAHRPGARSQAFIGVGVLTRDSRFDFPFPVDINSAGIGGPSAGLAFTLGIIDVLTNGRLVNGHVMAATGTIDQFGNVGDVGGVAQKAISVSRAGARLFLVPPQEFAVAKAHAGPGLTVVAVSTLQQALDAIAAHGGDLSGIPNAKPAVK